MERHEHKRAEMYHSILANIVVYAYSIFFAFFSIIGTKYQNGYLEIYSIILLLLSTVGMVWLYVQKRKMAITEVLIFLFILIIFLAYSISDTRYGHNETAQDTMEDFIARSIPAIFCAMIIANRKSVNSLARFADIVLIYFDICCTKILVYSLVRGISVVAWDSVLFINYQNVSYMAAFAVGIALYKLFIDINNKNHLIKSVYFFSVSVCTITAVISGGRGGVVLIVIYLILLFLYIGFIQKRATKVFGFIAAVLLLLLLFSRTLLLNIDILQGFTRAFEFLNPSGGINWEGTSGRYEVYTRDWELFIKRPLFGYGVCGAPFNGIVRTHNIVFDILIDGGIAYLLIWISIIYKTIKHSIKKMRVDTSYGIILVYLFGDLIMLNFSNVYMRTSAIWFSIAFALVDSAVNKNTDLEEE